MIKIENTDVVGFEPSLRGMRNPMNSWDKSDSHWCDGEECPMVDFGHESANECTSGAISYCIGVNDMKLAKTLANAGTDHSKFLRMIVVYCDITAPMYWWKEFDTYKVGTVRNSCSTMHKIHAKEFDINDFSYDNLLASNLYFFSGFIENLNICRQLFIDTKDKTYWWQLIQLLPSSYNQRSTVMMNYQVLKNMYHSRKNHKLDEWHDFCEWIESLPYAKELIIGKEK